MQRRVQRVHICSMAVALAVLSACGEETTPEAELRAWVDAMEVAAEEKDRSEMLDRISDRYTDARGNSRDDIGDTLLVYFLRQQDIAIISTIDSIDVQGGSAARMTVTAGMAGTGSGALGLSAGAYRFDLELEKPDDQWLLIGARWGELGNNLR